MIKILSYIEAYFDTLDWPYIITFIIIMYGINTVQVRAFLLKVIPLKLMTRYRVFFVGVLYGVVVYLIRGYKAYQIEDLLQSLVFTMVFHKMILENLLRFLGKAFLPDYQQSLDTNKEPLKSNLYEDTE